jgi:uncharacterized protein YbjT (DUF2867 family)
MIKDQKILVLGANGKTGRRVVEKLTQQGCENIRMGSRSANPPFDWENPNTWTASLAGIDSVYITFQPDLAVPSAADTIQRFTKQATLAGVQKIVLLSGRGEKEAQICEQIVMNTAAQWTIVRASWFNQNFSESFFLEPIIAGHVALPRAEALEPFADADDIADVVVQTLLEDKHNGQVYELTGPCLLTFQQAIAEISKATGREIRFEALSLEAYTSMLRQYQVPEDFIWLANYLFSEVLDGRNASVTHDIEKLLGRKAKDFTEYATELAATGIWDQRS